MSDINWHTDMENCPNGATVLIKYDDGSFRMIAAEDNDTPWCLYYPMKRPKEPGIDYPDAWAIVA